MIMVVQSSADWCQLLQNRTKVQLDVFMPPSSGETEKSNEAQETQHETPSGPRKVEAAKSPLTLNRTLTAR